MYLFILALDRSQLKIQAQKLKSITCGKSFKCYLSYLVFLLCSVIIFRKLTFFLSLTERRTSAFELASLTSQPLKQKEKNNWIGPTVKHVWKMGSGCGSVGRAVASDTRGPRFESSHWQKFIYILNICFLSTVY